MKFVALKSPQKRPKTGILTPWNDVFVKPFLWKNGQPDGKKRSQVANFVVASTPLSGCSHGGNNSKVRTFRVIPSMGTTPRVRSGICKLTFPCLLIPCRLKSGLRKLFCPVPFSRMQCSKAPFLNNYLYMSQLYWRTLLHSCYANIREIVENNSSKLIKLRSYTKSIINLKTFDYTSFSSYLCTQNLQQLFYNLITTTYEKN